MAASPRPQGTLRILHTCNICNTLVSYLQRVRDICTQYGVIMVCDETITAFGRLGEYVLSCLTPVSTPPLCSE